jgi:glycerol-1-phosphatase
VVADRLDLLRALCATHWQSGGGPVLVHAGDHQAAVALAELGLAPVE